MRLRRRGWNPDAAAGRISNEIAAARAYFDSAKAEGRYFRAVADRAMPGAWSPHGEPDHARELGRLEERVARLEEKLGLDVPA